MKRIYIAGPLSGPPNEYLANVRRFLDAWRELADRGYAVYCPAADLLLGIVSPQRSLAEYRAASLPWLDVSDAVYVIDHYHADGRLSLGTASEIEEARRLGIQVTDDMDELPEP